MKKSGTQSSRTVFLLAVVTSLTLSACATQRDRRGPPPDRPMKTSGTFMKPVGVLFTAMDANGDKVVTRAEADSGIAKEWAAFERRPSAAYFAQWSLVNLGSPDAAPTFLSFDRDFNGVISEDEFADQLSKEFLNLDENKDNRLERSEMLIAFQAPQGRARQEGEQGGRQKKGQGGRPPR